MANREDLGLALSLGGTMAADDDNARRVPSLLQLNLMPEAAAAAAAAAPHPFFLQHKMPWSDLVSSSPGTCGSIIPSAAENRCSAMELARPFLKGIDVNRAPLAEEREAEDDAAASSSPNSTVSSVSAGKRSALLRDAAAVDSEADRAYSGGGAGSGGSPGSDDEDGGEGSRKKLRLSKDQSAVLEESFKEHNTLNPKQKLALAKQLNLRPRQVEVWFQNRRARTKLKQTEVDCEILKRCCENLTEENRRLQKEVQELRALKLSPQFYMHMTPPTTLTMCPSCERVAVSSATASASAAAGTAAVAAAAATAGAEGHSHHHHHHHRGGPGAVQFPFAQPHPQTQPQQQVAAAQTQMHPFFHHHRAPMAAGGVAGIPWPPMPLRTGGFLDGQAQRS